MYIYCVVYIVITDLISFESKGQWTIQFVCKYMIVWCVCILDTDKNYCWFHRIKQLGRRWHSHC
jgi:hypothetical protein